MERVAGFHGSDLSSLGAGDLLRRKMTEVEQKLTSINRDIDQLLQGLGQEGLLDDQFAQLMQLQACFRAQHSLP